MTRLAQLEAQMRRLKSRLETRNVNLEPIMKDSETQIGGTLGEQLGESFRSQTRRNDGVSTQTDSAVV